MTNLFKVTEIGFENIAKISLDHDLDRSAMVEWVYGAVRNYKIDYSKIREKQDSIVPLAN